MISILNMNNRERVRLNKTNKIAAYKLGLSDTNPHNIS